MTHDIQTRLRKYGRRIDTICRQRRHLLICVPLEVPLASEAGMNHALDSLEAPRDPRKLTQLAQRMFGAGMKISMMDMTN